VPKGKIRMEPSATAAWTDVQRLGLGRGGVLKIKPWRKQLMQPGYKCN